MLLPIASKTGAAVDNIRAIDDQNNCDICRAFDEDFAHRSLDIAAVLELTVPLFPIVVREYAELGLPGIEFGEDVVANLRLIIVLVRLALLARVFRNIE